MNEKRFCLGKSLPAPSKKLVIMYLTVTLAGFRIRFRFFRLGFQALQYLVRRKPTVTRVRTGSVHVAVELR